MPGDFTRLGRWSTRSATSGVTLSIQIVPFGVEEKLLISRDITRLEAVARMRRDFIANVSHELKTPLTVVSGFIETLQDLDLEPRQRDRFLQLMHEQAKSMQRLVDDLLTLSALESEQNALRGGGRSRSARCCSSVSADAKALSAGPARDRARSRRRGDGARGSRDELASAFGNLVSATRSATRRRAARSRSAGASDADGARRVRGDRHRASASRRSTCRG